MSAQTMFTFDKSDSEVLTVCNACSGTWTAFAWTMADAEARALAHEGRCHPGREDGMRTRLEKRHAARRKSATKV